MKKLLFTAFILLCSMGVKAQINYGIQASGVLSNAAFTDDDLDNTKKEFRPGFAAGIFVEFPISDNFGVIPSVNFMQKGVKVTSETTIAGEDFNQEMKASLNYIEVPVIVVYTIGKSNFYIGAGPSFGYGLSGKLKGTFEFEEEGVLYSESFNMDAFKSEDENGAGLKRFDFGITGMAGYKISSNFSIAASYLHGVSNIASDDANDAKFSNRNILISLAYKI